MAPSILKTIMNGMFKTSNITIDRIINFCSWRFFIVYDCTYKYRKKAVPRYAVLLLTKLTNIL